MLGTVAVVALGGRLVARARLTLRVALRCIKRLLGRADTVLVGDSICQLAIQLQTNAILGVFSAIWRSKLLYTPTRPGLPGSLRLAATGHHPAWVVALRPPARRPRPARAPRPTRRPSAAPASWLARYDGCTWCIEAGLRWRRHIHEKTNGCHPAGGARGEGRRGSCGLGSVINYTSTYSK